MAGGGNLVHTGVAAGWMVPRGLQRWEREISFVARADMTPELGRTLRATLPHEQIAPKKFPLAFRAVETSPFLPLTPKLAAEAPAQGVRVHTVGVDRVSAGFFYIAEGGPAAPVRAQGNLVEMLAGSLKATSSNAEITALQDGLIDRLLAFFSDGAVSELAVELADALPRMASDGTGLEGTQLEVFEIQARALNSRSARWETSARDMANALQAATTKGERAARVPLYGEARQHMLRPLKVQMDNETQSLPARYRWTVIGQPREELRSPERGAERAERAQPAQPTPSPPRSGPSVPRPQAALRRAGKGVTADDSAASPVSPPPPSPAAAKQPPAEVARPAAEERPAAVAKPADDDSSPAVVSHRIIDVGASERNGATREAEPVAAAAEKPREEETRDDAGAHLEHPEHPTPAEPEPDSQREDVEKREAAKEKPPKKAAGARPAKHAPRTSHPRAVVVLLLIATAIAVYVRWHPEILRFVLHYLQRE
jgi:hypothetical protein